MIHKVFFSLLIAQIFLGFFLRGEDQSSEPILLAANNILENKCNCGCSCSYGCPCGCGMGLPCCCSEGASQPCVSPCEKEREYEEFGFDSCDKVDSCCSSGIWMPEAPEIFEPFLADPRQIVYSVGWRFNDQLFNKNVIDVSFGDSFPIYRWCDITPLHGVMQIELEGAVWAIFEPTVESAPLVNADYYVGVPLTFAFDKWSFRLRGFHISSHIGDEFLLTHPGFDRRNASAEYIDFFASYQLIDEIRLYYGLGYIVAQDDSFRCNPFYTEGGIELHMPQLGYEDTCDFLRMEPFFGADFRWKPDFDGQIDQTYVLGYEISKTSGLARKLRAFLEYHDGFSLEGQFCRLRTNYLSIRFTYGF